jgi:hypothetical protein
LVHSIQNQCNGSCEQIKEAIFFGTLDQDAPGGATETLRRPISTKVPQFRERASKPFERTREMGNAKSCGNQVLLIISS